jgi:hypothetical protein
MSSVNKSCDENFSSEINSKFKDVGQIERKNNKNKFIYATKIFNSNLFINKKNFCFKTVSYGIDDTINKEDYKFEISQNGKFAITFDSGKKKKKLFSFFRNNLYNLYNFLKKN